MKTIKVPPVLYRETSIAVSGEGESKAFEMSISSEEPYLRYDYWDDEFYYEVISHAKGAIDETRLKAGLPILFNHNRDQSLGNAKSYTIEGGKCVVKDFVWSASEFAQVKKKDAESGALPHTSVGYRLLDDGECIGAKDGHPIYKFKVEIFEGSLVTIPADTTVGPNRQRTVEDYRADKKPECTPVEISIKNIDENTKIKHKPEQMNLKHPVRKFLKAADDNGGGEGVAIEVVEERERVATEGGMKAERQRVAKIQATTLGFNRKANLKTPIGELEAKAISEGLDDQQYLKSLLDNWTDAKELTGADASPKLGMDKKQRRHFSLAKLMLEAHTLRDGPTGLEKEVSEAAAALYSGKDHRQFSGFCVPHDIAEARMDEDHDLDSKALRNLGEQVRNMSYIMGRALNATAFSAGGALVGTEILGGSFIELLRNAALIGQGPLSIIELNGLVGNIAIPKQTGTTSVYWLAEGATIADSQMTFAQLVMSPKRMGARTAFTKQLLAQSSLGVEMLVRGDIAQAMGIEEDRVVINGTGTNGEPLGILNTTGVGANVTFGGAATFADMIALEYNIENANVRNAQLAFLLAPLIKSYLKQTLQVAASTFPIYLQMPAKGEFPVINGVNPGVINEYPSYATKNAPSTNQPIFGQFANNVCKARWGGFDVVVDPFTGAASETIYSTFNQWLDVGIRYPQGFEIPTDAPTAP